MALDLVGVISPCIPQLLLIDLSILPLPFPSLSPHPLPYLLSPPTLFSHSGDGKCVICDSYVRPCTLVRICDECNYGSYQGRCTICGGPGVSDAYYCKECTIMEKDVRTRPADTVYCFAFAAL